MKKYLANTWSLVWKIFEYLIFLGVAAALLSLILFSGAFNDLRAAGVSGLAGKSRLTAAIQASKTQNWTQALAAANDADTKFTNAIASLDNSRLNPAVKSLGLIRTQIDDLEYLAQTGEILSRSLVEVIPIVQKLDDIRSGTASHNFADLPPLQKTYFLQTIYEAEPEVAGLKANLDLAALNLSKIHHIGILWPLYGQISNIKQELDQASALLVEISPTIKLLPALAGYPSTSHFLLVLQNNDELRPSGGFIGTYGLLNIQNGTILSLTTDDSYHLDMPASLTGKWNLQPPAELQKYLDVEKWYLRDANWSPDWPQSAHKIAEVYNGESSAVGQPATMFTGVAAITPDLVADLIKLTGPITVNGTTYNAADFQPLLQYNVEVAYKQQSISSWDRKNIINSLVGELKTRLFSLPTSSWGKLFALLDNNIKEKNIQLYLFNDTDESLVRTLGADGALAQPASDYLMVVDANLASFKSDAVIKKDLSYAVTASASGLQAAVKLTYSHTGEFDWRTTRYRSYTRIYAPLGSKLISLAGTDSATQNLSVVDDETLHKTIFGFFLTIEPGSSRTITLSYQLPASVSQQLAMGQYQLFVQKQAGQRINSLNLSFRPLSGITQNWSTNLNTDKTWQLNLSQKYPR
jgi:hypothetical protein